MFDLFRKELQVIRRAENAVVNGKIVKGAETIFTIKASVQQTDPETMMTLEEGYRTKDSFTLFTETELKTARRKFEPDLVVINEQKFRVVRVGAWQNRLINHYEIIVTRADSDNVN